MARLSVAATSGREWATQTGANVGIAVVVPVPPGD